MGCQPLHPVHRTAPQSAQFCWLGIRTKEADVVTHRVLEFILARQGGSGGQTQQLEGAPFGRPVIQPLLNHQPGGGLGYLMFAHHLIVAGMSRSSRTSP